MAGRPCPAEEKAAFIGLQTREGVGWVSVSVTQHFDIKRLFESVGDPITTLPRYCHSRESGNPGWLMA